MRTNNNTAHAELKFDIFLSRTGINYHHLIIT